MVKRCRLPSVGCVAGSARQRIFCRQVIGVSGVLIVVRMTGVAVGRRSGKMIVDMTANASRLNMSPHQWKGRFGMVERRRRPPGRCMTCCTIVVKVSARMIRIGSIVEICLVTAKTIGA